MKKGAPFLLLLIFFITGMLTNSCKKDSGGTLENLLAGGPNSGPWQLASVMVYNFVGNNNTSTDTLNTKCQLDQFFTFKSDGSCAYQNFSCIQQTTQGKWALSEDRLNLLSNLSCQDTARGKTVTSMPFDTARIINVGQYSLVLETGDINTFYLATTKRHIKRYGFIRK